MLLTDYVEMTGSRIDLLLIGGLALQAYGNRDRATQDIDGELVGELAPLIDFLSKHQIPADLGADISGWSVVAMPPGYRDRATILVDRPNLRIRLLAPTDFVIANCVEELNWIWMMPRLSPDVTTSQPRIFKSRRMLP